MPRPRRIQFAGAKEPIVTRGDARRKLFHDAGHYERFCPAMQIGTPSETDGRIIFIRAAMKRSWSKTLAAIA
jgi:hypothetical protein